MNLYDSLKINQDILRKEYFSGDPFPNLIIDNFFPPKIVQNLEIECRKISVARNVSDDFQQSKKFAFNNWELMPNELLRFCTFFNSGNFLNFLENITDIHGLISDPYLEGGGMHQTYTGGFLKMHTDFNWQEKVQLNRRINVILYLNSKYETGWDGKLLFSKNPSKQDLKDMVSIEPLFNRLIIFNTNDTTFHGHPTPLNFPKNYPRTSLAFYYYTSKNRSYKERKRFKTATTRYIASKNSKFQGKGVKLKTKIGYFLRRWTPFF